MTHTFFGAALAGTGLAKSESGRQSALATATLMLGANLPDVDVVAYFHSADAALYYRRGWTHGVVAWVVLPVVLTAVMLAFDRWSRRGRDGLPADSRRILGLAALAVWSHPLLDWLNTYGIRLLMPFGGRWFYGDALYIIDPWVWLTLGGVLFLNHSQSRRRLVRWGVLALLTTAFLFLVSGPQGWPFWLWASVVAALVVVRVRRGEPSEDSRRRLARFAVAASVAYGAFMVGLTAWATHEIHDELEDANPRLMVGPDRLDPLLRYVVVPQERTYRIASYHLLRRPRFELSDKLIPRHRVNPMGINWTKALAAAWGAPCVRGMMSWMRYPFYEVDAVDDGYQVFLLDARYVDRRTGGFGAAVVDVGEDFVPRCDSP